MAEVVAPWNCGETLAPSPFPAFAEAVDDRELFCVVELDI
jgi:hypothetical protein